MALRTVLLTSAVFVTSASIAYTQPLDFSSAAHSSAAGARDAVAVDVNRDGWLDVVTANTGSNVVAVLMSRGDGSGFGDVRTIPVGAGAFDIDAGDLNRDGVPDIVVTTPGCWRNRGSAARWRWSANVPIYRRSWQPGMGCHACGHDARRDSRPRLYRFRSRVVVLPGTGTGGFGAGAEWAVGTRPQGVAAADLNHDGLLDLVVATTGTTALDVLYGTATGGLTRRTVAAGRSLNVLSLVDMKQ